MRCQLRKLPILLLLTVAACRADPGTETANEANVAQPPPHEQKTVPRLPSVEPSLTRKDLLLMVAEAASAFAAGVDDREQQRELDGRPFAFRIALCGEEQGNFRSSYDSEEGVLRLSVRPDLTMEALSRFPEAAKTGFEAVEGFWVPRPWLLQASCPTRAAAVSPPDEQQRRELPVAEVPVPAPPFPPTVGIAEFHDETSARSARREGRGYELTRNLEDGSVPGQVDLVLEGRLRRLPDGKVVTCAGESSTAPPRCVISVRIDAVRYEQPSGEELARWGRS